MVHTGLSHRGDVDHEQDLRRDGAEKAGWNLVTFFLLRMKTLTNNGNLEHITMK